MNEKELKAYEAGRQSVIQELEKELAELKHEVGSLGTPDTALDNWKEAHGKALFECLELIKKKKI